MLNMTSAIPVLIFIILMVPQHCFCKGNVSPAIHLNVTQIIPDNFKGLVKHRLFCNTSKVHDADTILLMAISISKKTKSGQEKLASINFTHKEVNSFDYVLDSSGYILKKRGLLRADIEYDRAESFDSKEYVCAAKYLDRHMTTEIIRAHKKTNLTAILNLMMDKVSEVVIKMSDLESKMSTNKSFYALRKVSALLMGQQKSRTDVTDNDVVSSVVPKHTTKPPMVTVTKGNPRKPDCETSRIRSCAELRSEHCAVTSSRQIITWKDGTQVLCDTETDGGGWTVFQRRVNGNINFYRGWKEYEQGFGSLNTSFWLGLIKLHHLMYSGAQELRVDLRYQGKNSFASYAHFQISGAFENYKLWVRGYNGTAGDSLSYSNRMVFTTYDRDGNDCATKFSGAWWYKACHLANLNGVWGETLEGKGLNWRSLTSLRDSVSFSEMKTRPIHY